MQHAMIDVEALRLKYPWQAPLMEVGVLFFDERGIPQDEHSLWVDQESIPLGFHPEDSTVEFWKNAEYWKDLQSNMRLFGEPCERIIERLAHLSRQAEVVWFAGPTYDQVMLESYFDHFGIECPWKYNDTRDFRTIRKQHGEIYKKVWETRVGHHCAIEDCKFQVKVLHEICKKTGEPWR